MLNYYEAMKVEAAITKKALELVGDQPPEFNIWPTRELIRQAWAQGFDLVKVPRTVPQNGADDVR
jgi:hypothetical protein